MKDETYESLMQAIAVISYFITTALTIYICTKIYNADASWLWKIIAVGTGIIINTSELLALTKYLKDKRKYKNREIHEYSQKSLYLALLFAFFSVTASIGSIKVTFDRGEKIVNLQDQVKKQMNLSDNLIKSYSQNADEARGQASSKRRLSNMYLQKSERFLNGAQRLLDDRKKDIDYLGSSIENTIALSFYENFASVFGGNAKTWVLIFAILLSFALEASYWFSSAEMNDIKKYRRMDRPGKTKVGKNGILKSENVNYESYNENDDENVRKSRRTFTTEVLKSGRNANKAKAKKIRHRIIEIYNTGFTGASEISRILNYKVTPQRVSQIKKELGLE